MEATREERQQMRQRGAGTRKAKEVNFGFSFGSPATGFSAPAPPTVVPEAQNASRTQPAPNTTPRSSKISQSNLQAREIERTPGSARNKLPQRPSTYDIPSSDDRPEQTRSNKRRKIGHNDRTEGTPTRQSGGRTENGVSQRDNNSASSTESQASHIQEPTQINVPISPERPINQSPQPHISTIPETSIEPHHPIEEQANGVEPTIPAANEQLAQGASPVPSHAALTVDQGPQASLLSPEAQAGVEQSENMEQLHEKRHKDRSPPRPEDRIQVKERTQRAATEPASPVIQTDKSTTKALSQRGSSAEPLKDSHASTVSDDIEISKANSHSRDDASDQDGHKSQGSSTKAKKPQDRPDHEATAKDPPELSAEQALQVPTTRVQDELATAQVETAPKTKRPRGRSSLNKKAIEAIETEQPVPDDAETSSKPRRGRKATSQKVNAQPEPMVESAIPKPQRDRRGKQARQAVEPEPEPATADQPEPAVEPTVTKPQRGRPAKKQKRVAEPELEVEPELEPEPAGPEHPEPETESAPRPRGRPGKKTKRTSEPDPEPETEPVVPEQPEPERESAPRPRGRPGKKTKQTSEPESEPETENQPQPDAESAVSKTHHGKAGKKDRHEVGAEAEPEAATDDQSDPELASTVPKPQRGRPGKKAKRATEREHETETDNQPEPESRQDQPRRKTREPRGETVPVTVYRLANVNSLNGITSAADGSGDEEESADELTTHQRTKIPNRGGVNPADVLSQICRETLEKTLNTLKDGIANEANATRRAEWSRKRKAVESFGSELDSRLMDLSGLLDSNFVLGVQMKKSKREMMDLRNHLYRIRRERENIALQMDAVRSKHMEEEKGKSSRNTISNSLHSLELALDRNQQRSSSAADSSLDLEFMLRTVADLSSRAPGAQGGLLNQIRAFNAQLEATAARLER